MHPSTSSPPKTPVTTEDVPNTRPVRSPLQTGSNSPAEHIVRPKESPSSSTQHQPATALVASSHHSTINTSTSASAIKPNVHCHRFKHFSPVQAFSFPSTSNSATTYNSTFPNSTDFNCISSTAVSTEFISQRTPNVYINGLPPHFSEQDLFALARQFGDIKSVRTFTRHVSEKPTGYGFVLFNDVESAQRCIEGLRKQRDLHPSFSKQVHRIPGTEYAQHNAAAQPTDLDENSFKSRMEKLKDSTSTNLYIEGLPLSTDEESLAALMLPHNIKSSRLFKTKLSNPPRIIAFVRLETRAAADETIERLHGRMVRGWNDPGCRISVRFADSAEQRELRRTERSLKNGEPSPSRLTIAQAALLNLHGQGLQANARDAVGDKSQRLPSSHSDRQVALNSLPNAGLLPTSRSLPSKLSYTYRMSPLLSTPDLPITSEMNNLLQSIHGVDYDNGLLDNTAMRNLTFDEECLMTQQAQFQALASASTLLSPNALPITLQRGHAQARNGFTPAEELILEAHAQRLQLQTQLSPASPILDQVSLSRKINANLRNFNLMSHELPRSSRRVGKTMLSQDTLPTISEDEFHAMGPPPCSVAPASQSYRLIDCYPPTVPTFVRPPSRAVSIVPPPPDYEEPGKRSKNHQHTSIGSKQVRLSSSFDNRQPVQSGERKLHPSLLQGSTRPNNTSNRGNDNNTSTVSCDMNAELQHTYLYSHGSAEQDKSSRFRTLPASQMYSKKSPNFGEQNTSIKEGPKSPAVVSPALTYSSHTPSTLSPATPFFGSFSGCQDAFEVMAMENEDAAEGRLIAKVSDKTQ